MKRFIQRTGEVLETLCFAVFWVLFAPGIIIGEFSDKALRQWEFSMNDRMRKRGEASRDAARRRESVS